jgi:antitoxin (DNA-binding transcriptional repressor) of toxin-antitoxin stability system
MDTKSSMATSDARANLSDVIASVRLLRRCVYLTRRDKPQAALVPVELADAVVEAGGADTAAQILRDHVAAIQK